MEHKTKEERVADFLREGIISGKFPRGSKLKQTEIAEMLGTSITPVREAIKLLEAEGFILGASHRGAVVAPFDIDQTEEIVDLRVTLESKLALAALGKLTKASIDILRGIQSEIEAAANMSVQEIFVRDGEPFFRHKESQVISRLLGDARAVLSTGGGAFLAESNQRMISEKGVSIWLNAPVDVLWGRVRHKTTRPLLRTDNPRATLEALYNVRVPSYSRADLEVPSDGEASIDEMVDRVVGVLATRPDVLELR